MKRAASVLFASLLSGVHCFVPSTSISKIPIGSSSISSPLHTKNHDLPINGCRRAPIRTNNSHGGYFMVTERDTAEVVLDKTDDVTLSPIETAVLTNDSLVSEESSFSYGEFAKQYPFVNNVGIATVKTAAADLIAQTVIAQTPLMEVDIQRSFLFMAFGAIYLGGFQYLYQVQVFKRLFDIDRFTNLSWKEKLEDKEGLKALALQTALDLTVLTFIYLPTFYIFKAGVFSGSADPNVWASTGLENYVTNFAKDEADLLKVWFPADLVCFSVPLYLRLPVRHVVSFVWTAYLSFARGGH